MKFRRTKVICTIGPQTNSKAQLLKLAQAGMNVARLNMSHGEHKWHKEVIRNVNAVNKKYDFNIAIMLDTKGPEIRTGDLPDPIKVKKGQMINLTIQGAPTLPPNTVWINYDRFVKDVHVGDRILIDNGLLKLKVIKKNSADVECLCLNGYTITSRRHINLPKSFLKMPAITKKDWKDIAFGIKHNVDFIALSFVRKAKDIEEVRKYLSRKKKDISIISKIESHESIPKVEEIIEASDGILIARGDLGAELPYYEVPVLQREIINICNEMNKPVIVATHILESMIQHSAPTRAEVNDLSQAVFQRADATMLSGETAVGNYPVEAVKTMVNVINRIEEEVYRNEAVLLHDTNSVKEEIVEAASVMATNLKVKAILVFTHSGRLALLTSRCRPSSPIFSFSRTKGVDKKLQLAFGVHPFHYTAPNDPEKKIKKAFQILLKEKYLKKGDGVIVVSDVRATRGKHIQSVQVREIS
jgi:pyruvate kinase